MAKHEKVSRNGDDRAAIEAKRGIARNEKGQIVFTKAQKLARIAHFEAKIADCDTRKKNAKAEIAKLKASL